MRQAHPTTMSLLSSPSCHMLSYVCKQTGFVAVLILCRKCSVVWLPTWSASAFTSHASSSSPMMRCWRCVESQPASPCSCDALGLAGVEGCMQFSKGFPNGQALFEVCSQCLGEQCLREPGVTIRSGSHFSLFSISRFCQRPRTPPACSHTYASALRGSTAFTLSRGQVCCMAHAQSNTAALHSYLLCRGHC